MHRDGPKDALRRVPTKVSEHYRVSRQRINTQNSIVLNLGSAMVGFFVEA